MKIKIRSLSKNEDFKNLLNGKKIINQYGTLFFKKIPKKNKNDCNVSFVTKRKIGNAVIRNKIKRRLRNIMIEGIKKTLVSLKYSYLFIAKRNVFKDDYIKIKDSLLKDLKKIS